MQIIKKQECKLITSKRNVTGKAHWVHAKSPHALTIIIPDNHSKVLMKRGLWLKRSLVNNTINFRNFLGFELRASRLARREAQRLRDRRKEILKKKTNNILRFARNAKTSRPPRTARLPSKLRMLRIKSIQGCVKTSLLFKLLSFLKLRFCSNC